ncbi:predicted protein [Histoplasma capsulatum G186AR]|uniref:Uncharacterized protein n=1 Tax=Ajellomyces capsulatus (strain G186AR / H82 / ATCC MYA-2454 / RMSCC 2432) TaxID=447093 RepID=C0NDX8_AJECG|nr:uncharacterized protein HCBG_02071 [Histoplasma capsulatum G186AR]EEH10426.1 predicted protein [Histoplasma capsulatum G186AR]
MPTKIESSTSGNAGLHFRQLGHPKGYPIDWPIDRSCLNLAVTRLHKLTETLTSATEYTASVNDYVAGLPVTKVERPLGPKARRNFRAPTTDSSNRAGGHGQVGPENLFSSRFVLYITSGNQLSTIFSIVHTLTT